MVSSDVWRKMVQVAVNRSFNQITVCTFFFFQLLNTITQWGYTSRGVINLACCIFILQYDNPPHVWVFCRQMEIRVPMILSLRQLVDYLDQPRYLPTTVIKQYNFKQALMWLVSLHLSFAFLCYLKIFYSELQNFDITRN